MPLKDGQKSAEERRAEEQAFYDSLPTVTRCGVEGCTWSWEGPAGEGRDMFAAHRRLQHEGQVAEETQEKPLEVPRDPLLDVVRDIVGHGQQVPIRLPEMPVTWRREWIERLGGVIVIDPDAVMPLAMQRDKNGGDGREALERMDRGEPQRAERSESMANGKRPRGYWTRERIIEAIKAWAREHGEPPGYNDWERGGSLDHPVSVTVAKKCGSWSGAIREAGFEPRTPAHRVPHRDAAEPEPTQPPEPEPEPEPAADREPIAPPPLPAPRDPDKVDVFDLLGSVVTPELIAWHEDEAKRHLLKVKALRAIREQLEAVG
jgi:hypothetical protein